MSEPFERSWAQAAPVLEEALSHDPTGGFALDDIRREVDQGFAHFWRWPEDPGLPLTACAVTEFVIHPRVKRLHYWLLGGDMASIRAMLPKVEEWGLLQGCTMFSGIGRPGFARAFAADGYAPAASFYLKTMPKGRLQ